VATSDAEDGIKIDDEMIIPGERDPAVPLELYILGSQLWSWNPSVAQKQIPICSYAFARWVRLLDSSLFHRMSYAQCQLWHKSLTYRCNAQHTVC
jgi:hypothetical protein